MTELKKPKVSNEAQKELDKAEKQFQEHEENLKEMTIDRMNMAPKQDLEPQNKIAQADLEKMKDIYLKPSRSISSKEKFNEKFRDDYNFSKEYVNFIPEHKEIIGETIELWTKPFPGCPAEYWQIPTGKPIYAPRYVAERLKNCVYHRFVMQQQVKTSVDGMGQYFGAMAVDTTIQRLDAIPVSTRKSIFMGATEFSKVA